MKKKKLKILVGMLTANLIFPKTVQSLVNAVKETEHDITVEIKNLCTIPRGRNALCQQCLKGKYDALCFIDSDQTFPANAVDELAESGKQVIGYAIAEKYPPYNLNVGHILPGYRQQSYNTISEAGTHECEWIGTGFLFIRAETLMAIEYPWFQERIINSGYTCSDFYFSCKVGEAGKKIFYMVNPEIGHLGVKEATLHDHWKDREARTK